MDTSLTPMLVVPKVADAIAFYQRAFAAERDGPYLTTPGGAVAHAQIRIGGALVMLADEALSGPSPRALGGTPVRLSLTVADVDALFERALAAGAEVVYPLADQFYGHRSGRLRDPMGHEWAVGQVLEALTPKEMQRRMDAEIAKA